MKRCIHSYTIGTLLASEMGASLLELLVAGVLSAALAGAVASTLLSASGLQRLLDRSDSLEPIRVVSHWVREDVRLAFGATCRPDESLTLYLTSAQTESDAIVYRFTYAQEHSGTAAIRRAMVQSGKVVRDDVVAFGLEPPGDSGSRFLCTTGAPSTAGAELVVASVPGRTQIHLEAAAFLRRVP